MVHPKNKYFKVFHFHFNKYIRYLTIYDETKNIRPLFPPYCCDKNTQSNPTMALKRSLCSGIRNNSQSPTQQQWVWAFCSRVFVLLRNTRFFLCVTLTLSRSVVRREKRVSPDALKSKTIPLCVCSLWIHTLFLASYAISHHY